MKKDIHPVYKQTTVKCVACDNKINIMSSEQEMTVTLCSHCHPAYSGGVVEKKALGRVDRFNKKLSRINKT